MVRRDNKRRCKNEQSRTECSLEIMVSTQEIEHLSVHLKGHQSPRLHY